MPANPVRTNRNRHSLQKVPRVYCPVCEEAADRKTAWGSTFTFRCGNLECGVREFVLDEKGVRDLEVPEVR